MKFSKITNRIIRGSSSTAPSASTSDVHVESDSTSSAHTGSERTHRPNRSHHHQSIHQTKQGGVPPASQAALDSLLPLRLRGLVPDHEECVICAENFQLFDVVTTLPCGHMHHSDCIFDWLSRHCTCPACRFELPTDDAEFENEKRKTANVSTNAACTRNPMGLLTPTTETSPDVDEGPFGFDAVLAKRNHNAFFDKTANFDLIMMRTLRVKEDLRQAKRSAEGEDYLSNDDEDEDTFSILTDDEFCSDNEILG